MLGLQTRGPRPGSYFTLLNVVSLANLSLGRVVEMLFFWICMLNPAQLLSTSAVGKYNSRDQCKLQQEVIIKNKEYQCQVGNKCEPSENVAKKVGK